MCAAAYARRMSPPTTPPFLHPGARFAWTAPPLTADPLAFHRTLPGYAVTPLREPPGVAAQLGLGRVLVKDESDRLGLPAFKILGASYAVHRAAADRSPTGLVTATDGNHGRALARTGRLLGIPTRIHVPVGVHPEAVAAIEDEGALVLRGTGSYDDAVRAAAADAAADGALLVQDMAWPGYEDIPRWIVEGYTTLFAEVDDQLAEQGGRADAVVIPVGVGSLALAALIHYRAAGRAAPAALVSVEPENAACVLASLAAGRLTTVPTEATIMARLNCGTPTSAAWAALRDGLDAAVAVSDDQARSATDLLHAAGIPLGPCGAAPLAGLQHLLTGPDADAARDCFGLDSSSTVVLIGTEGIEANAFT